MSLLETLASQNQFLKGLLTKVQWGAGRCPSCESTREEGHVQYCELARILEDHPYKSQGHRRGRPTTLPGVWGQMARSTGGVAELSEEFQVAPQTLRQWAYCERRPSRNGIALVQVMVGVHGLKLPVFKCKSNIVGISSDAEEKR